VAAVARSGRTHLVELLPDRHRETG
jgi:hypothetical protein